MRSLTRDRWFPIVDLFLAAAAGLLWYGSGGKLGALVLTIALIPWGIRLLAGRFPVKRTPLDAPMLLFLLTAVVGTFTAYDREMALGKFWVLLGAILIYYALAAQSRRDVWLIAGAMGPLAAALALYFVLTNNWQLWPAEIGVLNQFGLALMTIRPTLPLPVLHPNTLGGMMALLLPFVVAFWLYARRIRRIRLMNFTAVCGIIAVGGLFLTSSIGAWLALAISLGIWYLWEASPQISRRTGVSRRTVFGVLALTGLLGGFLVVGLLLMDDAAARLELIRQSLRLVADFPITGSGLATFPALYAQYIQVTPFFFAAYSNLFVDVWLELGLLGLLSLLFVWGFSLWRMIDFARKRSRSTQKSASPSNSSSEDRVEDRGRRRKRRRRSYRPKSLDESLYYFRWATFAALLIAFFHAFTDDALFGRYGAPLLFLGVGMTMVVTRTRSREASALPRRFRWQPYAAGLTVLVLLVGAFLTLRSQLMAAWLANQGALAMARVELAGWPTNQWATGKEAAELARANRYFEQALVFDEQNQTALYRLGLSAMLAREYETAVNYLEQAYAQDESHRGVIKSLGYSYVWNGDYEQAVPTLAPIPEARNEMNVYSQWWRRQNRADLAAKAKDIVTILDEEQTSVNSN